MEIFLFLSPPLLLLQPVGIYPKKYEWAASSTMHLQGIQQIGGDCSLLVRAATIDFDDGAWECQVTASDFTTQDALTSEPVQLVVRGKNGSGRSARSPQRFECELLKAIKRRTLAFNNNVIACHFASVKR